MASIFCTNSCIFLHVRGGGGGVVVPLDDVDTGFIGVGVVVAVVLGLLLGR